MEKIQKYLKRTASISFLIGIILQVLSFTGIFRPIIAVYGWWFLYALGVILIIINDLISKRKYKAKLVENDEVYLKQKAYKVRVTITSLLIAVALIIACPIVVLGFIKVYVNNVKIKNPDNKWVAYMVGGFDVDPIVFQDELYFPIKEYPYGDDYDSTCMEFCGYMGSKSLYENQGKIVELLDGFDYIMLDRICTDTRYKNDEYLQVEGGSPNEYAKASCLEDNERIQQLLDTYSSYILIQKGHTSEDKYLFPEELIVELEQEFGECSYDVKDFEEMEEVYYIFVNPFFQNEGAPSAKRYYIATIFMDDNGNFYYCNSNNQISDEMSQKIRWILEAGDVIGEEYDTDY